MWTRKELKRRGNERFRANYWFCVLAALVMPIVIGGGPKLNITKKYNINLSPTSSIEQQVEQAIDEAFDEQFEGKFDEQWSANGGDEIGTIQINGQEVEVKALVEGILHRLRYDTSWIAPLVGFIVALAMIAGSFGIALKVFLLNPLEVSGRRFFTANLYDKASLSELGFCFTTNYLNIVKTMFFRGLYNWLWYLLLVVPGIIKSYEYRMIPYIMAENPDCPTREAFAMSKRMMAGNKWDAFVLDLSFIGWSILNMFTMGILGLFYVNPYRFETMAALYDALKTPEIGMSEYENYVEVE